METFLLRIYCRGEQVPLSQPEARKEIFSQSQKSKMFFSLIDKVRIESCLLRKRLLLFYLPVPPCLESRKEIFLEETNEENQVDEELESVQRKLGACPGTGRGSSVSKSSRWDENFGNTHSSVFSFHFETLKYFDSRPNRTAMFWRFDLDLCTLNEQKRSQPCLALPLVALNAVGTVPAPSPAAVPRQFLPFLGTSLGAVSWLNAPW